MQAIRQIECTEQEFLSVAIPPEWRGCRLEVIILPLEGTNEASDSSASNQVTASSGLATQLMNLGKRCAALPILDYRSPEQLLGYDDNGLPT
jgi:hypothetical protein